MSAPPSYHEATGGRPLPPSRPIPLPPAPAGPAPVPAVQLPQEEVKLFNTQRERELYDTMADLFAIIKTTEHLERAYVRDLIQPSEYESACARLISQFKAAQDVVKTSVPDMQKFMIEYKLDCPAAARRFTVGVPATIEHGGKTGGSSNSARVVAETVQNFITVMDSLKLDMAAVDQLYPLLTELMASLNNNLNLPPDFEMKVKLKNWLTVLNHLKASDKLDEEQCRQLLFDLEQGYSAFHKVLGT